MQVFFNSVCGVCQGSGRCIRDYCGSCGGEGRRQVVDGVRITLPAGVRDGMTFAMKGRGDVPVRGGVAGDLHVTVKEEGDVRFRRDEDDNIHYDCRIGFPDALLGTKVVVPTVVGRVKVTVPPFTDSGSVLRIRGRGVPNLNTGVCGDQLVHVRIGVPKRLSVAERELVERMRGFKVFQTE